MIISYGSVTLAIKEALYELRKTSKVKAGLFRIITLWPSPEKELKEIASRFDKILVVELNKGQYREEIERILGRKIEFMGRANGRTIDPNEIVEKVKNM